MTVGPFKAESWHKSRSTLGTNVLIRSSSSMWSLGSVDLNEVGPSVLHLPRRGRGGHGHDGGDGEGEGCVVHVEVKIAEPSEHCSVVVVVWRASVLSTALAVSNDSDMYITVRQADIDFESKGLGGLFEIQVPPGQCIPFGWADPDTGSHILVALGPTITGAVRVGKVSFLKAGEVTKLSDNKGGVLLLSVAAEGGGRKLRVTYEQPDLGRGIAFMDRDTEAGLKSSIGKSRSAEGEAEVEVEGASPPRYSLSISLASFGLSLVLEKPIRR